MTERRHLSWEGGEEDARAAQRAAAELRQSREHQVGDAISLGNEFTEIRVARVETRNGSRLLIESPKSGQWVALCPLEIEALTWQDTTTFSAMIGNPFAPLINQEEQA